MFFTGGFLILQVKLCRFLKSFEFILLDTSINTFAENLVLKTSYNILKTISH